MKVYSHQDDASGLLWIGDAVLILKNYKKVRGPFLAQIVFKNVHSEDVKSQICPSLGGKFRSLLLYLQSMLFDLKSNIY